MKKIYFILPSIVLISCKKEKTQTCFNIPKPAIPYESVYHGKQYYSPAYRPGKSEELVYTEWNYDNMTVGFYLRDLRNNSQRKLFESAITSPCWVNSNLLFFCAQGRAWKTDPYNNTPVQVNVPGRPAVIRTNGHEELLVSTLYDGSYHTLLLDRDLNITNSFNLGEIFTEVGSWRNGLIAFQSSKGISIYDTSTRTQRLVYSHGGPYYGTCWMDDEHLLLSENKGIFQVNVNTGEAIRLVAACSSERYRSLDYSPAQRTILAQRENFDYPQSDGKMVTRNSSVIIYLDRQIVYTMPAL